MAETLNLITADTSSLFFETAEGTTEVELVQFLKYRIDDNKKPVYGFTNDSFSKTIKGKRIVSGFIGIKKISRDIVNDLFKRIKSTKQKTFEGYKINPYLNDYEYLSKVDGFTSDSKTEYEKIIKKINEDIYAVDKEISEDFFLNIEGKEFDGLSPLTIKIFNTKYAKATVSLQIENVTFVSKEGEFSVKDNTVLEVYSFIGNVSKVS